VKIKRSDTLVVAFEGDELVFHNYLEQRTFTAQPAALEIVRRLRGWTDLEAVAGSLPGYSRGSVDRSVQQLIELCAIVVEGSEEAAREEDFALSWLWGPWAAAYHFSTRGGTFLTGEVVEEMLREQVKWNPSPPLFTLNGETGLPAATIPLESYPEPYQTMARRRTNRFMLDRPIALRQVMDCLKFSLAITAVMEDPAAVDLPLKMTPSGGARNPYEGYVCVRNVDGLRPGTYHYSAMERTLAPVDTGRPPAFERLMAGQSWASNAGAVIFLAAFFERSMWKYHHAAAYRIALIEAGHIGQNIMLVATEQGLVANGTGAFASGLVEETLGLTGFNQSAVYALVLGVPDPSHGQTAAELGD
jgi:SagB-type dehydrogenase family enzyme